MRNPADFLTNAGTAAPALGLRIKKKTGVLVTRSEVIDLE